ncbi:AfsR/SARP family transcriptional regulator [Nonomuraea sp. SYSU D8015]|uniref:AfsR/SARP family transcriptional regulator n=1 Tax=Nonomuraea sp. SYSU D8015 TaxID=2593644 RepID=UPI001660957F|nr:helix-turn-helix domain-containing protein [Nonomuraea sp. SYSU D8015]
MRVEVLGPVNAYLDSGDSVEISGVRLRMLLSRLALEPGRPVSAETLIDDLWGEEAPAGATAALHSLVARLRKALSGAAALELVAGGYRLSVRPQDVDACQFEELVARGRRELVAGTAPKGLNSKSTAALADQVLPALTAAMTLLKEQAPAEAGSFRRTVLVAIEAATRPQKGEAQPHHGGDGPQDH